MQEERDNPALEKSYAFALEIIGLVRGLEETGGEKVLSKQLLLSGTAIGWHVEEAVGAQSGPDFLSRMGVAYTEAEKARYWLRLLHDSQAIEADEYRPLLSDCEELLKILGSICHAAKKRRP